MNKEETINEFVTLPYDGVTFPFDPNYQVNLKECDTELEIRNERIAAHVAQKYNLVYRQGDGITTKFPELTLELRLARKEISKWMSVGKIRWFDDPANVYYFTFNSWEERI